MSLYKQLSEIQRKLNAPKNQINKFGGYNYRSCEDILMSVKPLLGDLVITVTDDIELVGDRYYIRATARITDGKECITTTAYAREPLDKKGSDASQITGAASSYARKYALNGLLLIDDNKDADATNDHGKGIKTKPTDGALDGLTTEEIALAHTVTAAIKEKYGKGDEHGAYEEFSSVEDQQIRVAIWALLARESKIRSTIKRMAQEAKEQANV